MSTLLPVVDKSLIQRLAQVKQNLYVTAMQNVRDYAGNPYGVETQQFGGATAFLASKAEGPGWWNRVAGLQAEDTPFLDQILDFFRARGLRCNIDVNPASFTGELAAALSEQGLVPSALSTVLYGLPGILPYELPRDAAIRELSLDRAGLFAELWAAGFEVGNGAEAITAREIRQGAFTLPGSRLFVVYEGATPVAMAGLYVQDGIGFLNVGATLPAFRGKGYHTALTRKRLQEAARAGCELAMAHTGTWTSQNNMERAGLHIAYLEITWTDKPTST